MAALVAQADRPVLRSVIVMKLPALENSSCYRGLYVYDFGEWTAVGYTAEEIAVLLESEAYAHGQVYRIQRIQPDGSMELRGVSAERFKLESGLFFWRSTRDEAEADFRSLLSAAQHSPPPCRAALQMSERLDACDRYQFVTALIFPAEYEDDVAAWLLRLGYVGGDVAEGGVSHVTNYYELARRVLAAEQLTSAAPIRPRSAEEVLAAVRQPVQRVMVA
jgi:hypothetical protein